MAAQLEARVPGLSDARRTRRRLARTGRPACGVILTAKMSAQRTRAAAAGPGSTRHGRGSCSLLSSLLALCLTGTAHAGGCTLKRLAEVPVTMYGTTPLVHAKVNGVDALFIADTGAFFNTMTPSAAKTFKLHTDFSTQDFYVNGVGGNSHAYAARVDTLTLFNFDIRRVAFIVAGNDLPGGAVGLLGENVWRLADPEFDLSNGLIRIMRPEDCKNTALAYWAAAADQRWSVIDIERTEPSSPLIRGSAYLNGNRIRVIFDTGAARSLLTRAAARHAGVTPESGGVVAAGTVFGMGRAAVNSWIGPFGSFKIGDEEIKNTHLRFSDSDDLIDADMLLGADFFLSHRIYVAHSQHKLYFTYGGGAVFNLTATSAAASATAPAARVDEPTDAAGFARRGGAALARQDYPAAIGAFTRACQLAPTEAVYFYQRALAYRWARHESESLADLDQALRLKPEYFEARLERARLNFHRRADEALIDADLQAAAQLATPDRELELASTYEWTGEFPSAIAHYTRWIDAHERSEVHRADALNGRCRARARWGQELAQALADCDAALRARPGEAAFLDSRGLVHLRRAEYQKAIADYDAALGTEPHLPWSLYGRGIARTHSGDPTGGQADLAAAAALHQSIAAEAAGYGIVP
jgi:tetratricopeptide (TPR) repeat protein